MLVSKVTLISFAATLLAIGSRAEETTTGAQAQPTLTPKDTCVKNHRDHSIWNDGCNACLCRKDGTILCTKFVCNTLPADWWDRCKGEDSQNIGFYVNFLNCACGLTGDIAEGSPAPVPAGSGPRTLRARRGGASAGGSGKGAAAAGRNVSRAVGSTQTMMRLYSEDSPGLKVDPVVVLVMSLVFIASREENPFNSPRSVHTFKINGLTRIRKGFLDDLLKPVLRADTLGSIITQSQNVAGKLQAFDIAKSVNVTMDSANTNNDGGSGQNLDGFIDVVLDCQEHKMLKLTTGTELSDNEASANVAMQLRNLFGGAESLVINSSIGTKTSSSFQGIFSTPLKADPLKRFDLIVMSNHIDNQLYNSHDLYNRGIQLTYKTYTGAAIGTHQFAYNAIWREVANLSPNASYSVRNEAGHSFKSSVSHIYTRDTRDHPTIPTTGSLVKDTIELSGIGGDVYFGKCHLETQVAQTVLDSIILNSSFQAGVVLPFNDDNTRIADRFMLGGPNSLRGFQYGGIGPRDKADSLGGDMFYGFGAHILTPLTKIFGTPRLFGHLWVNGGNLSPLVIARGSGGKDLKTQINHLLYTPSIAAGVGFVYQHSFLRVELNYSIPLAATSTDSVKSGFQLGLGLNFL
ncbi:hypothetical protein H4219_005140 [Mycoemilia scoparia]|uniref:Bacterial surface antigen (D15) domain-containing protein n=1 Tax=Mycoemilia scoparia TaxID=417184 RepID=A0A9W7ZP35_9FUNG|nr:hypothetical protein H4219_005140 [Mycoemilia scoparia]